MALSTFQTAVFYCREAPGQLGTGHTYGFLKSKQPEVRNFFTYQYWGLLILLERRHCDA